MAGIIPVIALATGKPARRYHFRLRHAAEDQLADRLGARELSLARPVFDAFQHLNGEANFDLSADRGVNGGHDSPSMMDMDFVGMRGFQAKISRCSRLDARAR
jgi:hypothetical protein